MEAVVAELAVAGVRVKVTGVHLTVKGVPAVLKGVAAEAMKPIKLLPVSSCCCLVSWLHTTTPPESVAYIPLLFFIFLFSSGIVRG